MLGLDSIKQYRHLITVQVELKKVSMLEKTDRTCGSKDDKHIYQLSGPPH